jgi:CBS domain containing-hemolysin-like protein
MRSFRGVVAGSLVMEAIVVALSMLVVAKLGTGIGSVVGLWVVLGVVVALLSTCAFAGKPRVLWLVLALQLLLIACAAFSVAVAVIGAIFLAIWGYLWWIRRDVARRMAEGRLPSQQPLPEEGYTESSEAGAASSPGTG